MKKILLLLNLFFLYSSGVIAQEKQLNIYWKDGLKLETPDRSFRFSIGGRVHYDAAFLGHDRQLDSIFGKAADNVEVRRARIGFAGTINDALEYEFEFTFGEQVEYSDMYFAFLKVPFLEKLTIGHFREPFGMEEMTSSNAIVFMERSLTSAFGPSRNTGFMLQRQFFDRKLRAYLGGFRITNDLGTDIMGSGKHALSARLAYNPVYDTLRNRAFHFGLSSRIFRPEDKVYEIKSGNESNISPEYISSLPLDNVSNAKQLGAEFGYTIDRWCLQGEYVHAFAVQKNIGERQVNKVTGQHAFYISGAWFIRGGKRKYDRENNRFSNIEVEKVIQKGRLANAWELAARISHINVPVAESNIKRMTDATLGLNWYYNANSRFMMNYVLSRLQGNYFANALQFRMQVSF